MFIKRPATGLRPLVLFLAAILPASLAGAQADAPASPPLRLENDAAVFNFDPASGALVEITNKAADNTLTLPEDASAPLFIWVGTEDDLEGVPARVARGKQTLSAHRAYTYDGGRGLELVWTSLKAEDGVDSGVGVRTHCELDDGSPFLRLRTHVVNRGDRLVTGIFLGIDGLPPVAEADREVFSVPAGMGQQTPNPRAELTDQELLYTSPPTVPRGLFCQWLDVSGADRGFGTGYLNRRSMDMLADARFESNRSRLGWRLFRLEGTWTFMDDIKDPLIYPLQRGEDFVSDDWFLGLHDGDWHNTADRYRREYERVFAGDFLPWEEVSPLVKATDMVLNISAAWGVMSEDKVHHDMERGELRVPFLEVPDRMQELIDKLGVEPNHCLMVMLGQATHWGIYKLPDYFPVNAEAGGPEAFKEMIRRLREDIGIVGTHFYVHMAFNHPDATHYAAQADTGWTANIYANYDHLGRIACQDSPDWWSHWRDNVIPNFVEAGASGWEVDEGFGHHFICDHPGHLHGLSAESILTAQPRGSLRIFRAWREAAGPEAYLECEGGSDVGARHCDLWEAGASGPMEIVRYTHPDKLVTCFASSPKDALRAFVYGMHMLVTYNKGQIIPPEYHQFVALRKELREQSAPGYPQAFRDDRGLTSPGAGLVAKVYADDAGITVAYYSEEAVQGEVTVDCAALGHPEWGIKRQAVDLAPLEAGYFIIR